MVLPVMKTKEIKKKPPRPEGACFQAQRLGDFRCLERALLTRKTEHWMGSISRREWFHPKLSSCGRISEHQTMMTIRRADACSRKEVIDIFCDIVLFVLLLNIFLRSYSANLNMSFL
jgi:hypothetical protein